MSSRMLMALSVTIVTHFAPPGFLPCEVDTQDDELWCPRMASLGRNWGVSGAQGAFEENLYPHPRMVTMNVGLRGSSSIFLRRRLTGTSIIRSVGASS